MILRTPPQRKRRVDSEADADAGLVAVKSGGGASAAGRTPVSDRRLVLYDRPTALVPTGAPGEPFDDMVCTYHCRQMVKSEFMVALDTAEKQVQGYRTKIDALEEQLSKSEDERMQFLDKLNYVEQELAATKGRESALQERLLKELAGYQERYRDQVKKINELEVQLNKEIDSRIKAESSASSAMESIKDLEGTLQQLSGSSEREKKTLKKELSYMKEDLTLSASKLNAELEKTRLRAENYESEAKLLNEQLVDLKKQLDECLCEKNEMELKLLNSSALPNQHAPTDDQKLVKLLQEELRNYEKEVHEARRLESSHTNVELLKEKLLEEQGRRERAEKELLKLLDIEAKAHKLELELASCTTLLSNIPDVSSYADIPQRIADLQKQALLNLNKVGEVTSWLKELEVALEFADLSKQRAEGEATLAKERAESAAKEVKRLELMLAAISEERDKLRKEHATESDQSAMQKMIRELESTIHEQKELISNKDAELNIMNERLSLEARKVKSLEREGDQLRSQVALLESKTGHGDYSASSTEVLRMVNTLAVDSEAKQTIEALQAELKKTKERLQAVEELKGQADAGTVVDANIAEKLAQLKNQITILEERMARTRNGASGSADLQGQNQDQQDLPPLPSLTQFMAAQTDLLCQLVQNQYQPNRGRQQDLESTYQDFLATQPPLFHKADEPLEADNWLRVMESKFELIRCSEESKTRFAAQQLRGPARVWCDNFKAMLAADHRVLWNEFRAAFRSHHIPTGLIKRKMNEFLALKQGNMSVHQYSQAFNNLAQYARQHVATDENKQECFRRGLNTKLQSRLVTNRYTNFNNLVDDAIVLEDAISAHKADKKRKAPAGSSSAPPPKYRLVPTSSSGQQGRPAQAGCWVYRPQVPQQQQWIARPPAQQYRAQASNAPQTGAKPCYNCGNLGHFARDCRLPPKQSYKQPAQGQNSAKGQKKQSNQRKTGRINYIIMEEVPQEEQVMAGDVGTQFIQQVPQPSEGWTVEWVPASP